MNMNEKLNAVVKSMTVSDLGNSVLNAEKARQFVKDLSAASPILAAARRIDMASHTKDIDRIGFAGRLLEKGVEGTALSSDNKATPATNQLVAKELVGQVAITDSTLEDNIEKEGFQDSLISLMADRASFDMEELFINGDTTNVGDTFLGVTNGWLKKAGNQIDASDYDASDVEDLFEKMLLALPVKYLRNKANYKFFVSFKIENDYRNVLKLRNTNVGDAAQTGSGTIAYKGIEIVMVPNMPEAKAMLVSVDNLVYGIYRQIKVEPERSAKARATTFVLSTRVDCHFENEDAAVVAIEYGTEQGS